MGGESQAKDIPGFCGNPEKPVGSLRRRADTGREENFVFPLSVLALCVSLANEYGHDRPDEIMVEE